MFIPVLVDLFNWIRKLMHPKVEINHTVVGIFVVVRVRGKLTIGPDVERIWTKIESLIFQKYFGIVLDLTKAQMDMACAKRVRMMPVDACRYRASITLLGAENIQKLDVASALMFDMGNHNTKREALLSLVRY